MIYVDPYQLLMGVWGMAVMMIVLASQRARRSRIYDDGKAFDDLRAQILADRSRTQVFSASVRVLTCDSQCHRIEDVVSCGVVVARLCVDCDKQIDAPEWLAA